MPSGNRSRQTAHPLPVPPAWRPPREPDRSGAPLFLLCDFRDQGPGQDPQTQAQIEAAPGSPACSTHCSRRGTRARTIRTASTWSSCHRRCQARRSPISFKPTPAAGVPEPVIEQALRSIALRDSGGRGHADDVDSPVPGGRDGRAVSPRPAPGSLPQGPAASARRRGSASGRGASAPWTRYFASSAHGTTRWRDVSWRSGGAGRPWRKSCGASPAWSHSGRPGPAPPRSRGRCRDCGPR